MVEKAHGKTVKTLIVQEEEIVSLGLRCAVEQMPEAVLVGEVRDGRTAVATAIEQRVQLVLIDIVLRELDGIQATKLIKEAIPAKIIIVTAQQNATDVIAGFVAGADAYCMRDVSAVQLIKVIRAILAGGVWLDSAVAFVARGLPGPEADPTAQAMARLTNKLSRRERQVLQLLAAGLTNQEIAARLSVGQETIKTHVRHLMDKLGVTDRTQAAVRAVAYGWLDP